ncbi:MAG: sigma-70 family RNA polymerase sigma factor, partial [Acidimicrobiales bacterium]|nr:sigma-70 family RNA polymerase sigma factor [Acidimicrobiales bacterium]
MNEDDTELAVAAAAGDRDALAGIYDRYADRIHDFATSMLRDADEAADVTSETFLRAFERLGQLRDPAKLKSWLFAVARHEALARIRARQRTTPTEEVGEVPAPDAEAELTSVERADDEQELRRLVWEAADGLNERDRTVLELHVRQGLVGQELADAIGDTENGANVALHRTRARFERAVGALLVARRGRRDCPELAKLLSDWDGTFDTLVRKRVARHVERCEVCDRRRKALVSPFALMASAAVAPAPAGLRDQVLERVEHISHVARLPRGWRRDGFPPPMPGNRRSRRAAVAATVTALVVLFAAGVVTGVLVEFGDEDELPPVATSTSTTVAPTTTAPTTTTEPTTTTTTTEPPSTTTEPTTTTTDPPPQTTTTTTVADTQEPTIGEVTADPQQIWEDGGPAVCDGMPRTSAVEVAVTDDSGVESVTLTWQVGGEAATVPMQPSGGSWTATVGPVSDDTIPFGSTEPVGLVVHAVDGAGNDSTQQGDSGTLLLND